MGNEGNEKGEGKRRARKEVKETGHRIMSKEEGGRREGR